MTRALITTLTACCIAGYIAMPALADGATTSDAAAATTSDAINTDKTAIAEKGTSASDDKIAEGTDAKKTETAKKSAKEDPAKAPKTVKKGDVDPATRLASFATGVLVGAPIAIVRRTHMEVMQGEHDLIGDYDTWWKKAAFVFPGAVLAVPFGAVSGGLGGCMYAVKNAWSGSGEEPFGKKSFSLEDIGN